MARPLLRFGQYLLVLAMFAACGGHWLVLQSVAWSEMIVEYSRTDSLTVAVEKTFDGRHPCGLCQQIASFSKKEQKRQALVAASKLEFVDLTPTAPIVPKRARPAFATIDCFSPARWEQPPVRPPRLG
jgi:hypothetical protein